MKIDIKGLILAYIGCIILTIALIIDFKYDINWHYNVISLSCLGIFCYQVFKDLKYWENALYKIEDNYKQLKRRLYLKKINL